MSAERQKQQGFVFTGWHMLAIMVLFFGTIISVNITMAWNAVTSWSGLVVPNTYVASQQFNGKAAAAKARAASGIIGKLEVKNDIARYEISHPERGAIDTDSVTLHFRRPVGEKQNFDMELQKAETGVFSGQHDIPGGHWIVEAIAMKDGKVIVHEGQRIAVTGDVQ